MERSNREAPIHVMSDGTEILPPRQRRQNKEKRRPRTPRRPAEDFTGNVKLVSSNNLDSAAKERLTEWGARFSSEETKSDYNAYINSRPRNKSEVGPSPEEVLNNPEDQWSLNDLVDRAKEVESFEIKLDESQMNEIEVRAQEQLAEADFVEVVEFAHHAYQKDTPSLLIMAENAIIDRVAADAEALGWSKEQELNYLGQVSEIVYYGEKEDEAEEVDKPATDSSPENEDLTDSATAESSERTTEEEDALSDEELEELAKAEAKDSSEEGGEDDDALSPEELEELARAGTESDAEPTPATPDTPTAPEAASTTETEPTAKELELANEHLADMLEIARENSPELAAARKSLQEKKDALAEITARKIGKPISLNRSYNEAREEYLVELRKLGRIENQLIEDIKRGRTDEEKKIDAVALVFEQQKDLRTKVNEIFGNTKVTKFNKAVGKFFAEGSKKKRIAKGAAVGLGIGLVGGAVGAVAGTVGVASVVATRFYKNYAIADRERKGMAGLTEADKAELLREMPTEWGRTFSVAERADSLFDRDKKAEQKKRRKAVGISLGATALGAGAGALISEAANIDLVDRTRNFSWEEFWRSDYERHGDHFNHVNTMGENMGVFTSEAAAAEQVPAVTEVNELPFIEGDSGNGGADAATESAVDTAPQAANPVEIPAASDAEFGANTTEVNTITPGEGWSQTMREMGVPAADRVELLNRAGPALVEQGIGYVDFGLDGSQYGIRMTPDGQMPKEAIDILVSTAKENGIRMDYLVS